MIELRTINEDNYEQCFNLKASVENENFVDSVIYSLAEACIQFLKNEYGAKRISVPVELQNTVAQRFWGKMGFVFSDNIEDGYIFMRLAL